MKEKSFCVNCKYLNHKEIEDNGFFGLFWSIRYEPLDCVAHLYLKNVKKISKNKRNKAGNCKYFSKSRCGLVKSVSEEDWSYAN